MSGRWGAALPIGAALACLALSPPQPRGGDLSVQLGLELARRAPAAMEVDPLSLAAARHPGFGGALQGLFWGASGPSLGWLVLLQIGVIIGIFVGVSRLWSPRSTWPAWGLLLLAVPRPLGPALLLLDLQPTHRMLALPPLLWGLGAALRGRGFSAGLALGLGAALHPSTGAQAAVIGLTVAGRRAPTLLPGLGLALAALLWRSPGAAWGWLTAGELSLLRLRLGHHLDVGTWPVGPRVLILLHVILGVVLARRARGVTGGAALNRGVWAAVGWVVLGLLSPHVGVGLLLQLHPLYAEQWLVLLSLPLLGSALRRAALPPRLAGLALLVVAPWLLADRPLPRPQPAAAGRAAAALRPWDDPWPRVTEGSPAAFTVKDGGEIISGPSFLAAWAAQLEGACGAAALRPAAPAEPWLGYVRLRRRCRVAVRERGASDADLSPR